MLFFPILNIKMIPPNYITISHCFHAAQHIVTSTEDSMGIPKLQSPLHFLDPLPSPPISISPTPIIRQSPPNYTICYLHPRTKLANKQRFLFTAFINVPKISMCGPNPCPSCSFQTLSTLPLLFPSTSHIHMQS